MRSEYDMLFKLVSASINLSERDEEYQGILYESLDVLQENSNYTDLKNTLLDHYDFIISLLTVCKNSDDSNVRYVATILLKSLRGEHSHWFDNTSETSIDVKEYKKHKQEERVRFRNEQIKELYNKLSEG